MSDLIGYGEFIKHHRIASGYKSQRQLADVTGISSATLSRIESEIQKPQMDTIRVLSKYLKSTNLAELMDRVGYFEGLDDNKKEGVMEFFLVNDELDTVIEDAVIRIMSLSGDAVAHMESYLRRHFLEKIIDYENEKNISFHDFDLNVLLDFIKYSDLSTEEKTELNSNLRIIIKRYSANIEMVEIPIYGEIRAGYNFLVQENIVGYETVSKESVRDGNYYYLIVNGDSMIEEGIREGMRVLVKSQNYCDHGKIGVVIVNGDEATLKRVFYEKETVILQAANRTIPPRNLPIHEVRIQGQVKKVEFDV